MGKRGRVIIAVITAIGLGVGVTVFMWGRQPEQVSLQQALSRAFNRPAQFIEINLPPADGRYPGAVLLTPQPGQTLPLKRADRPSQVPDVSTSLKAEMAGAAEAALRNKLIGSAAAAGDVAVDVTLENLRVFEVDLDKKFKQSLTNDEDVYRAEKRGLNPRVVVRTYEAVMSLNVSRTAEVSAEAWKKAQGQLIAAGGRIQDAGTIAFKGDDATAIAYETVTVNYVATTLSDGKPEDVELRESAAVNAMSTEFDVSAFNLEASSTEVRYVVMGNSRYASERFGNLRVVEPSIRVTESVFDATGAEPLLTEPPPQVLSESRMDNAVSRVSKALGETDASLFVFYYTGHAVTGRGGQLYLVTQDYKGDPAEDLGEDLLLGLPRAQLDAPGAPLEGSNIDDLLDVVAAVQSGVPSEMPGLYPVSKLARSFEKAGKPFVILIDACYEHDQMDRLRDAYNLTESGDYYGPDFSGGPQQLERFSESIDEFGTATYLRSENVVIFSATPGTVAIEVEDPRPTWVGESYVAPLAHRMYGRFEGALARTDPLTWGGFLRSIVDVKPIGEMRIHGSISWSDFTAVNEISMLRRRTAEQ